MNKRRNDTMEVKQIYSLMNTVTSEILGKQELVAEVNGSSGTKLGAPTEVRGASLGDATITVPCSQDNSKLRFVFQAFVR